MKWKNWQIQFLKQNYSKNGIKYCMSNLNRGKGGVVFKARSLDLNVSKQSAKLNRQQASKIRLKNHTYNVDHSLFSDVSQEYIAYLLGFMWADAGLDNSSQRYRVTTEILQSDGDEIEHLFIKTGKWGIHKRNRDGRKPQMAFICGQRPLYQTMTKYGYLNRSGSHQQALKYIPEQLHRFFWLGYLDGDGCIYIGQNKKSTIIQVCFASQYDQDWSALIIFLTSIGIQNMQVSKKIQTSKEGKISRYSIVRISKKQSCINLLNKLYQNTALGLSRKKNKFLKFISIQ